MRGRSGKVGGERREGDGEKGGGNRRGSGERGGGKRWKVGDTKRCGKPLIYACLKLPVINGTGEGVC